MRYRERLMLEGCLWRLSFGIGQELPKIMALERLDKEEPQSGHTVHRSAACYPALLEQIGLIASQLIRPKPIRRLPKWRANPVTYCKYVRVVRSEIRPLLGAAVLVLHRGTLPYSKRTNRRS